MAEKLSRQTGHCRAADGGLLTIMVWLLLELLELLVLEEVMVEEVAAKGEGIYLQIWGEKSKAATAMVGLGKSVRSMVLSSGGEFVRSMVLIVGWMVLSVREESWTSSSIIYYEGKSFGALLTLLLLTCGTVTGAVTGAGLVTNQALTVRPELPGVSRPPRRGRERLIGRWEDGVITRAGAGGETWTWELA